MIWKDIIGYEGIYQVSNSGLVKSLKFSKVKILKPWINKHGYLYVELRKNKKSNVFSVHRLVGTAFIKNPENKPQINHIDEDKSNNSAENLEWITNRQNVNYSANKRSTSKYPGVCWDKSMSKWNASCKMGNDKFHLGYFTDELDVAQAYLDFCKKHNLR